MLTKDAEYGYYNWVSHAQNLRARYEIYETNTRSVIKIIVIKHCESEVLHRLQQEHTTENRKQNFYASFKNLNYKFESNLDYIQDFIVRFTLAKLRISAHNLQIEAGRFSKKLFLEMNNFACIANH